MSDDFFVLFYFKCVSADIKARHSPQNIFPRPFVCQGWKPAAACIVYIHFLMELAVYFLSSSLCVAINLTCVVS